MTVSVKCPNPRCKHHEAAFSVTVSSPLAKKGGNARWTNMTKKQQEEHIARMTRARLRRMRKGVKTQSKK